MSIELVLQVLLAVTSATLMVQSSRLYKSSKLKTSAFFAIYFLLFTIFVGTSLFQGVVDLDSTYVMKLTLHLIAAVCISYFSYVMFKRSVSAILFGTSYLVALVALSLMRMQGIAFVLPVAAPSLLVATMLLFQARESIGQLLTTVRLLLLALVLLTSSWATHIVIASSVPLEMNMWFLIISTTLFAVSALMTFLTPIHTKDTVTKPVY